MMGMRFTPKGYGGYRRDPEQVRRDGWQELQMLVISLDDHRLTWPERALVEQLGAKLYGPRQQVREVRNGR